MASNGGFLAKLLILTLSGASPALAQVAGPSGPPRTLFDARLEKLRKASVTWDVRCGPDREVVDVVCLVPDVPTFLEAVKVWDRGHYFPILLDDVELNLRFLRAFRPAKVIRYPKSAPAIAGPKLMEEAIAAVGYSWREPGSDNGLPGGATPDLSPPAAAGNRPLQRFQPQPRGGGGAGGGTV